jgi:hypothetical protein
MAIVSRTEVSLRIRGDELDPVEVSTELGGITSRAVRKGEIWHSPAGRPMVAKTGFCHYRAASMRPGDLDRQIQSLFDGLSQDTEIWLRLASHFKVELFCGAFLEEPNEGIGLSPATIMSISQRGASFELDIHYLHPADASGDR